jgi:hypothetical protein
VRAIPRSPRRAAAATLVAALLGLGAISAGAGADPQSHGTVSEVESPVVSNGSAVAHCPAGKVISGGFAAPGFERQETPAVRIASLANGSREWRVDAVGMGDGEDQDQPSGPGSLGGPNDPAPDDDDDAPAQGTIAAYSYCGKLAPGSIKARRVDAAVPSRGYGTATARCGRGQRAIAGGFSSPGFDVTAGTGVIVVTSHKAGKRGWTVGGMNVNGDDPGTVSAIAYCLKSAPRLITRSKQVAVGSDQLRTIDVSCPAGRQAVSGGFDGNVAPSGAGLVGSGPIESFRTSQGTGWTTTALSVDEAAGATLTAYVYCVKAPA